MSDNVKNTAFKINQNNNICNPQIIDTSKDSYTSNIFDNRILPRNHINWVCTEEGSKISLDFLQQATDAIYEELYIRHLHHLAYRNKVGQKLQKVKLSTLKNWINLCLERDKEINNSSTEIETNNVNIKIGSKISSRLINELKKSIESLQSVVLNSDDFCTCNCNFCTCNCNFCTCNCNFCTCNCNFCTCNTHT